MIQYTLSRFLPTATVKQYGFFDAIGDFFSDIGDFFGDFFSGIGETILDAITTALSTFFGMLLYCIECALCKLIDIVYSMFYVFVGAQKVTYHTVSASGQTKTIYDGLVNVLLENDALSTLFRGMALIGMLLALAFTIWAVIKKAGDMFDEERRSLGQILYSFFKSVLITLLMTFIMTVTMRFCSALMVSISNLFDISMFGGSQQTVVFTSEDYADMYDVLTTIGTYSLNPSYNGRYNLNSCYNAIRPKLQKMVERGLFDVYYRSEESKVYDGKEYHTLVNTWQSVLQEIVRARNVDTDMKLDVYNETVSTAILNAINIMKTDASFAPLAFYQSTYQSNNSASNVSLGVVLFLTGTGDAARNDAYNQNVSITDAVRGPYYSGVKNVYSYSQMSADFDLSLSGIDHLMIILLSLLMLQSLIDLIINAAVRVFQLILLYVVSPIFIATIPLGEGSKFKSWKDAFIITAFGIFGSFIGMRLLMLYIPIIASSNLILFDNGFLDLISKAVLIWGGVEAAERSNGLISGILLGNGGYAAMRATETSEVSRNFKKQTGVGSLSVGGMLSGAASATGLSTGLKKATTMGGALDSDSEIRQKWDRNGGIIGNKLSEHKQTKSEQNKSQRQYEAQAQAIVGEMGKKGIGSGAASGSSVGKRSVGSSSNKTSASAGTTGAAPKQGQTSVMKPPVIPGKKDRK